MNDDNDQVDDLGELRAGTDPMDGDSTPTETVPETPAETSSNLDPNSVGSDPVNLANGRVFAQEVDIAIPGPGPSIEFYRFYDGGNAAVGSFGRSWGNSYSQQLIMQWDYSMTLSKGDGGNDVYTFVRGTAPSVESFDGDPWIDCRLDQGNYVPPPNEYSVLRRNQDGSYSILKGDGTEYRYDGNYAPWRERAGYPSSGTHNRSTSGKLLWIEDLHGNRLTLSYDNQGRLIKVVDAVGRAIVFTYQNQVIKTVTDPLGRTMTYVYDDQLHLVQRIDSNGHRRLYAYGPNHQLTTKTDERGYSLRYIYYPDGRAKEVLAPDGNVYIFLW